MRQLVALALVAAASACAAGQVPPAAVAAPEGTGPTQADFERQVLLKQLTDLMYFVQLGDEMIVRRVRYPGAEQLIIPAYLFTPQDTTVKRPVVLLVHGGIHGDFGLGFLPQVRSLVGEGYVVVAPEYRGSTGYGRAFYDAIDYGGQEVEDVIAALDYLATFVPHADTSRVGITGRSHGGFISLHAIFRRPELFDVAVAHVPVADLPTRIQTHSEAYHELFVRQRGFGIRLEENPAPYIERSPIAHVRKLKIPLLVQAADNDQDVFIIENHNLRDSMIAAGMDRAGLYTYREWHNPPGGHGFHQVDSPQARDAWRETVAFLNRYLKR